jgi:cytochrome c2
LRKFALLLGLGYLFCAGVLMWRERNRTARFETLVTAFVIGFTPAVVYGLHIHTSVPDEVLYAELAWGGVLSIVTVALQRVPPLRLGLLAIFAVVGLVLPWVRRVEPQELPAVRAWRLDTALYGLKVTEYRKLIPASPVLGGAVATLRDGFVAVNGIGDLFLVARRAGSHELTAQHLQTSVPINWSDFANTFRHQQDVTNFRTADLFAQDLGARTRLFATHHYWKADQNCFVVRVSMLEADTARLLQADLGDAAWKTIFESTPCIKLDPAGNLAHFGGLQIGGRLGLLNPNELLLTVGDHEHDGLNSPETFSQDDATSYGKTILINLADFSHQQFSKGHRNPQGLFIDGPDTIWETEHGPQGGDELNLVKRGTNYGWPSVTYGTQYGAHFWPGDSVAGSHSGYAEPFYSWVPSIGVSSLLVSHSRQFKLWEGDVLIASLRDGSLYRARVRDQRVVMMERIAFGRRLRDITEGSEGQLLMWTDHGALLEVEADNDVGGGETVFQACSGCHMIGDGESNGIGPDLRSVVGRPVASAPRFRYSPAMKSLGGNWTRDRLDQFLTQPQAYVPGTAMRFPGVPDAQKRKELIEFLASGANNGPPPEDAISE